MERIDLEIMQKHFQGRDQFIVHLKNWRAKTQYDRYKANRNQKQSKGNPVYSLAKSQWQS